MNSVQDVWYDYSKYRWIDSSGNEYTADYVNANPAWFRLNFELWSPDKILKPEATQVYTTFVPTSPTSAVPKDSTDMLIDYLNQNAVDSLQSLPYTPQEVDPDQVSGLVNYLNQNAVDSLQNAGTQQKAPTTGDALLDYLNQNAQDSQQYNQGLGGVGQTIIPTTPTTPDPYAGMSATDKALLEILNKLTAPSGGSPSGAIGIPSIEKPDSRLSPYEMLAIKTGSKLLTLIKDLPPDQQLEIVHDKYTKLLLAKRLKYERSLENGGYQKKQARRVGTQQQWKGGKRSYRKKANYRQA